MTEKSEMMDDDDKALYKKIGKTEIQIEKILANILNDDNEQFQTARNIIYCEQDDEEHGDDTYSVRSGTRQSPSPEKRNV